MASLLPSHPWPWASLSPTDTHMAFAGTGAPQGVLHTAPSNPIARSSRVRSATVNGVLNAKAALFGSSGGFDRFRPQ